MRPEHVAQLRGDAIADIEAGMYPENVRLVHHVEQADTNAEHGHNEPHEMNGH